jgi:hypothetical protein
MSMTTTADHHPFPSRYAHRWRWARSVPTDPHEYIVRKDLNDEGRADYDAFVRHIRQHGERRTWQWSPATRPKVYSYLDQGDGYDYWEAPVGLVNRKART